jgi:hypothetical protein
VLILALCKKAEAQEDADISSFAAVAVGQKGPAPQGLLLAAP